MLYKKIRTAEDLKKEFENYGRVDSFTNAGYKSLIEYLSEFEDRELDVISICVEFSEYTDKELKDSYGHMSDSKDLSEIIDEVKNSVGTVLETSGNTYIVGGG